jgi:hypothetical protein
LKKFFCLTLYLFLALVLMGCGGGDDAKEEDGQVAPDAPTQTPLSDQDRLATASVLSQQTPTLTVIPATITPVPTPNYDPGPYFTPRRQSPPDPSTFVPDVQIGDFTRASLQGNCQRSSGQSSRYGSSGGAIIYLSCQFMNSSSAAYNLVAGIPNDQILSGEPIVMKLQGDESFILGASGEGFLYIWTHGPWLFTARSPNGREPLDAFMQAFPY